MEGPQPDSSLTPATQNASGGPDRENPAPFPPDSTAPDNISLQAEAKHPTHPINLTALQDIRPQPIAGTTALGIAAPGTHCPSGATTSLSPENWKSN